MNTRKEEKTSPMESLEAKLYIHRYIDKCEFDYVFDPGLFTSRERVGKINVTDCVPVNFINFITEKINLCCQSSRVPTIYKIYTDISYYIGNSLTPQIMDYVIEDIYGVFSHSILNLRALSIVDIELDCFFTSNMDEFGGYIDIDKLHANNSNFDLVEFLYHVFNNEIDIRQFHYYDFASDFIYDHCSEIYM